MAFERFGLRLVGALPGWMMLWLTIGAAAQPSAAERETARGLMQAGDRLRESGDVRAALERYQSAHALMHVPTTGFDVARAEAELGMLVEARGVALEVSNMPVGPRDPAVFDAARVRATELAAQLDARIPSVCTQVTPAGIAYAIAIDGIRLPAEAREVAFRTNPGPHRIVIEAPGYSTLVHQVTLTEGQAARVKLVLTASVPRPAPGPKPLTAPGGVSAATTATLPPMAAAELDLIDPARAGRIRSLVGFAAGGALLITGAVTGIVATSKVERLERECVAQQCDATRRGALASSDTLANIANITIPLGLLGIGYGVYEWLTLPSSTAAVTSNSQAAIELSASGVVVRARL